MSESRAPSRREFLKASVAGAAGLAATGITTGAPQLAPGTAKNCIFINLVGGPSHIDTFDPKPEAPPEVRGPFRPIQTKVPGLHFSELFPKLAGMADKFSLIRSMHHTAPPIHECGFQLLNTGHLFRDGPEWPCVGAVMGCLKESKLPDTENWCLMPFDSISTGISISHGQGTGWLKGQVNEPISGGGPLDAQIAFPLASIATNDFIFDPRFEMINFITVNMFGTVFDAVSWDCHADGGSLRSDLNDIRDTVAPMFDAWFSRLIDGLDQRGKLDSTLIVATGEFGRTPLLNANGGRDHWAGAWTALVAGGGVKGGRVIGRTDARGTEPTDRPVSPQELVATIYHAMGVPPYATIPGPDGSPVAVYPGKPVFELF
jgi:Protein of unknown function (DUF1501)